MRGSILAKQHVDVENCVIKYCLCDRLFKRIDYLKVSYSMCIIKSIMYRNNCFFVDNSNNVTKDFDFLFFQISFSI